MNNSPSATWLLCTNSEDELLHRAINSCLSQTLTDFEFLIVVNGLNFEKIVSSLLRLYAHEERVKIIGTPVHFLNFSLSLGLHLARAPFIARMDADDVSEPNRLFLQHSFMKENPDVAVLGSSYLLIDEQSQVHGKVNLPESDYEIRRALRFSNPICHPSVMLRRSAILEVGGYLGGRNAEDYDLWLRVAMNENMKFANIKTPLLAYNVSPTGQARRSRLAYANVASAQFRQFLVTRNLFWLFGSILSSGKCLFFSNRA